MCKVLRLLEINLHPTELNPPYRGPWWWSGGQRPDLLLQRSQFESCRILKFYIQKDKNIQKEAGVSQYKKNLSLKMKPDLTPSFLAITSKTQEGQWLPCFFFCKLRMGDICATIKNFNSGCLGVEVWQIFLTLLHRCSVYFVVLQI